ncbi:MAG: FAD binding domain-containing protein [Jatrophihabitans sp.]
MKAFTYDRPTDLAAAATLFETPGSALLAGGTNLVDLMKIGVAEPDSLVDVGALGLDAVEFDDAGTLSAGAYARNSDLAADPRVMARFPVLSQALLAGASGQLRNAATTGGNIMQRTRCPYFMDVHKPCNKREPGSGCPAREGFHRMHAILGASEACIAVNPSDMAVALAALDAVVVVTDGADGERRIELKDFHRLPGTEPDRETTLRAGEIIVRVEIPALPAATNSTYRKVRDRASYAFAVVSVAAVLRIDEGVVSDVRIAFGGVAHQPWRARVAESAIRGEPPTRTAFAAGVARELEAAETLPQNAFKVPLLQSVATSVLTELAEEESR